MQNRIELARNHLAADHFLIVQLVRDLDTGTGRSGFDPGKDTILIIWPDQPTEFPPSQLTPVTNAVIIALATARTQFAAIRSAEL